MIKIHRNTSWSANSTYLYFHLLYSITNLRDHGKDIYFRNTTVCVFVLVFIFVFVLIWPASTPLSPRRPKAKRRSWRRGRGQDRRTWGAHLKMIVRMARNTVWSMMEQSCPKYAIIFRMTKTYVAGLSLPCRSLALRASVQRHLCHVAGSCLGGNDAFYSHFFKPPEPPFFNTFFQTTWAPVLNTFFQTTWAPFLR